jgi:hypothetical protein
MRQLCRQSQRDEGQAQGMGDAGFLRLERMREELISAVSGIPRTASNIAPRPTNDPLPEVAKMIAKENPTWSKMTPPTPNR